MSKYKCSLLFSDRFVLLVLHTAGDAIVARRLCNCLDNYGFETICTSDATSADFSIDISNEEQIVAAAQLLTKVLVLYTESASPVFLQAVEQILALDDLHSKTHVLIHNANIAELRIPRTVARRFTSSRTIRMQAIYLLTLGNGR